MTVKTNEKRKKGNQKSRNKAKHRRRSLKKLYFCRVDEKCFKLGKCNNDIIFRGIMKRDSAPVEKIMMRRDKA